VVFQESVDQDVAEPLNFVLNSLSLEMMDLADQLLEGTVNMDLDDEKVIEDLMRGLLEIRRRRLHQQIDYIRYLMDEAHEQGDLKATQYIQTMVQHTRTLGQINQAIGKLTSRTASSH
jgi:hypothetical protein